MPRRPPGRVVVPTREFEKRRFSCVFCGDGLQAGATKEHCFPRWLLRERGVGKAPFSQVHVGPGDDIALGQRDMTYEGAVAGRVCGACNNGWMSRLEVHAAHLLRDCGRLDRRVEELSPTERLLLARWSVKTAVAIDSCALGPDLVDPEHGTALAAGDMPPVAVVAAQSPIDLGLTWHVSQHWFVEYAPSSRAAVEGNVGRSYKAVMTVGHLLLGVCHWPTPAWPMLVSATSHLMLWAPRSWRTYPHRCGSGEATPSPEQVVVDFIVGTRIVDPLRESHFRQERAPERHDDAEA